MKKLTVWLISVVVLTMGLCMLTACGGVEGKYYFDSMETDGKTYHVGEEAMGQTLGKEAFVLELKSNKTATMISSAEDEPLIGTWAWKENNKTIELKLEKREELGSLVVFGYHYVQVSILAEIEDGNMLHLTFDNGGPKITVKK